MNQKKPEVCGSWSSPINAELVARSGRGLSQLQVDGQQLYWVEQFSEQQGRRAIMRRDVSGNISELTAISHSVRNRVHEYGGGDYVVRDGVIYYSNDADQCLYRQDNNYNITMLTALPEQPMACRYADPVLSPDGSHLICVRETHLSEHEVVNEIVSIPTAGRMAVNVLVSGSDFYASPQISPDGKKLLFLSWNHPQMPWDGTLLQLALLHENIVADAPSCIAGGVDESICQPRFDRNGAIYYVSDKTNWWNLYRYHEGEAQRVFMIDAELAYPAWVFACNCYLLLDDGRIVCLFNEKGCYRLALVSGDSINRLAPEYDHLQPSLARIGGSVFCIAANAASAPAIVQVDYQSEHVTMLHSSSTLLLDADYLSLPETMTFSTDYGKSAYAYFYLPKNPLYMPQPGELPPLIVTCHGGPTAAASTALDLKIQYWTSRGFAVVDVNYGGSTGYGRAYRNRLRGQWGVVDVADCVNAAKHLVSTGQVDASRLAIHGSSAGGLTVLAALTFYDLFAAGASYYGVADLEAMVADTHKFESHYMETLVGAYPAEKAVYQQRSPLYHTDQLSTPVIFLQGMEDKVVPPAQAEAMIAALEDKQLPHAYVCFAHEQHGFRDALSIKRALESELSFYAQIFGFSVAGDVATVAVKYLQKKNES